MTAPATIARPSGVYVGRVVGAPVRIGWSWLLLAGLFVVTLGPSVASIRPDLGPLSYAVAGAFALMLLGSVLLHEVGHALTARATRRPVHAIVADLWGGHTTYDGQGLGPGASALIAAAGPLANVVLGAAMWAAHTGLEPGVAKWLLYRVAVANLFLAAFNLLPGLPLDGGQLVESAVWRVSGRRPRGTIAAAYTGLVVVGLVVFALVARPLLRGGQIGVEVLWGAVIAWFLWRGAMAALARGRVLQRFEGVRLTELLTPVVVVPESTSLASLDASSFGAGRALVVVGAGGRPVGLLDLRAAGAVPADRRGSTLVGAALIRQPEDWLVDTDRDDEALPAVQQLAARGLEHVVVVNHGQVLGLLTAHAVQGLFDRAKR